MGAIINRFIKNINPLIHFQMLCLLFFKKIRSEILLKRSIECRDHFRLIIKFSYLIHPKFINPKRIIQEFNSKIKKLNFLMRRKLIIIIIFMGIMKSLNLINNLIFA